MASFGGSGLDPRYAAPGVPAAQTLYLTPIDDDGNEVPLAGDATFDSTAALRVAVVAPGSSGGPGGRGGCTVSYVRGCVYVLGGADRHGTVFGERDGVHRYGVAAAAWTALPPVAGDAPPPRSGHSAVVHGGDVWTFGGGHLGTQDMFRALHRLRGLDGADGDDADAAWEEVAAADPPAARNSHSAVLLGDSTMVVFGGADAEDGPMNDVASVDVGPGGGGGGGRTPRRTKS